MVLDSLGAAKNINIASGLEINNGLSSSFDKHDYYGLDINGSTNIYLSLKGLSSDIDLSLLDNAGNTIVSSTRGGSSAEDISRNLGTGRYYIDVNHYSGSSSYQLVTTTNQIFAAVNDEVSLFLGDFNGDIYRDVVRQEKGSIVNGVNDVQIIMGQSSGGFQSPFQITNSGITNGNIVNLIAGDFNGDGKSDLIRQEFGQYVDGINDAQFMEFQNGNFQVTRNMPEMGAMNGNFNNLIAGDFNGDGRTDLIRQEKGGWVNGDRDVEVYIFDANFGIQQRITMNEANINSGNDVELVAGNFIIGGGTDLMRLEKSQNVNGVNDVLFYNFQNGNFQRAEPTFNIPPVSVFNSTFGYGLVNAAAAVARSINQSTFTDVTNLGGNNWGNDLVNAPEAWARGYQGQGVIVAVIDSGVDYNHADLNSNIWTNAREIAGNGIDDDRNGYVDDVRGWDFVQRDNDAMDVNGHGTHVAGTIAAKNDGVGLTGVAYGAKIMPIRVLGNDGSGNYTDVALGVRYAVDNGAKVINLSLGGGGSIEMDAAIAYASQRGSVVVMAAGNGAATSPGYPAQQAINYGIAVGGVDRYRQMPGFSNRAGNNSAMQYVVAPAVDVYSLSLGGGYKTLNGTSMAAPHVAGVVALMLSANPNLTDAQVRSIITSTANQTSLSALSTSTSSNNVVSLSTTPRISSFNFFNTDISVQEKFAPINKNEAIFSMHYLASSSFSAAKIDDTSTIPVNYNYEENVREKIKLGASSSYDKNNYEVSNADELFELKVNLTGLKPLLSLTK
jgi:subtilisin family serine protease